VVPDYADGTKESIHQTPAIWQGNLIETAVRVPAGKKVTSISLDGAFSWTLTSAVIFGGSILSLGIGWAMSNFYKFLKHKAYGSTGVMCHML
jgi:hypothetical protein